MNKQSVVVVTLSWWVKPVVWLLTGYEVLFNTSSHPALLGWISKHGAKLNKGARHE